MFHSKGFKERIASHGERLLRSSRFHGAARFGGSKVINLPTARRQIRSFPVTIAAMYTATQGAAAGDHARLLKEIDRLFIRDDGGARLDPPIIPSS